jgi:hypothetical protein
MRLFLLLALLLLACWKLVSVVYEDAQTKERTPVSGVGAASSIADPTRLFANARSHPPLSGGR